MKSQKSRSSLPILTLKKSGHTNPLKEGPALYELEYLKLIFEELSLALKGRNFSTITQISIGVRGKDYLGLMQVQK